LKEKTVNIAIFGTGKTAWILMDYPPPKKMGRKLRFGM